MVESAKTYTFGGSCLEIVKNFFLFISEKSQRNRCVVNSRAEKNKTLFFRGSGLKKKIGSPIHFI